MWICSWIVKSCLAKLFPQSEQQWWGFFPIPLCWCFLRCSGLERLFSFLSASWCCWGSPDDKPLPLREQRLGMSLNEIKSPSSSSPSRLSVPLCPGVFLQSTRTSSKVRRGSRPGDSWRVEGDGLALSWNVQSFTTTHKSKSIGLVEAWASFHHISCTSHFLSKQSRRGEARGTIGPKIWLLAYLIIHTFS